MTLQGVGYCIIRGPNKAGKTCALQLIEDYMKRTSIDPELHYFNCTDISDSMGETFEEAVARRCGVNWAVLESSGALFSIPISSTKLILCLPTV